MISCENLYNKEHHLINIPGNYKARSEKSTNTNYKVLCNAYIFPWMFIDSKEVIGVFDSNKEYLRETALHYNGICPSNISFDDTKVSNKKVIFIGSWINVWGNWLTDNINRLWFLYSKEYKELFSEYTLVYTNYHHNDDKFLSENVLQLLTLIGVDTNKIERITEPTRFSEIIIPNESFYVSPDDSMFHYNDDYLFLIDVINVNYEKLGYKYKKYDKVYFSHSKVGKLRQIGEKRLEQFFKSLGYTVIYPEELSFYEQLYVIKNCEYFASTDGSCAHNTVFMNHKANIVLIPRASYITGYQAMINDTLIERYDSNIAYIDSSLSFLTNPNIPWDGPFLYIISKELSNYFKTSKKAININDLISYIKLCKTYKGNLNQSFVYKYYCLRYPKLLHIINWIISIHK